MTIRSDDAQVPTDPTTQAVPKQFQKTESTTSEHHPEHITEIATHILLPDSTQTTPAKIHTVETKKAQQILPGLLCSTSVGDVEEEQHQLLAQSFPDLLHTSREQDVASEMGPLQNEACELKKMFPELLILALSDVPAMFPAVILHQISSEFSKMSSKELIKISSEIGTNDKIPTFQNELLNLCAQSLIQKQFDEIKNETKRLKTFFPNLTIDSSKNEQELKTDILRQISEELAKKSVPEIEQMRSNIAACANLTLFQEDVLKICFDEITKKNIAIIKEEAKKLEPFFPNLTFKEAKTEREAIDHILEQINSQMEPKSLLELGAIKVEDGLMPDHPLFEKKILQAIEEARIKKFGISQFLYALEEVIENLEQKVIEHFEQEILENPEQEILEIPEEKILEILKQVELENIDMIRNLLSLLSRALAVKSPLEVGNIIRQLKEQLPETTPVEKAMKQPILEALDTYEISIQSLIDIFSNPAQRPFKPNQQVVPASEEGIPPPLEYAVSEENHKQDQARLFKVMVSHNLQFETLLDTIERPKGVGYIQKSDLPTGTKIVVRADLHGDLASFLAELQMLRDQGDLDENYLCKPGVQLLFLGDYVDRGVNDLEIMSLLLLLRMRNPNAVHLIRGNHEDIEINKRDNAHPDFFSYNAGLISQCYKTMPLAVLIADQQGTYKPKFGTEQRQYAHFSHGLFSPAVDLAPFLHEPGSTTLVVDAIPRFSEQTERTTQKATDAFASLKKTFEGAEAQRAHTYNWADVGPETIQNPDLTTLGRPAFSPEDIHRYAQATSDTCGKVRAFIRGHSHIHANYAVQTSPMKMFIKTLAVGNASGIYASLPEFAHEDMQMVEFTVASNLRDWEQRTVISTKDEHGLPTFHESPTTLKMFEPINPPALSPTATLPASGTAQHTPNPFEGGIAGVTAHH